MSYTKKTWHDGDTITAAGLNNMETGIKNNDTAVAAATPYYVPFSVSDDGGTPVASTTASFADVKAVVQAKKRPVTAEIEVEDAAAVLYGGLISKTPISEPEELTFAAVIDLGSAESPAPQLLEIIFSADGVGIRSVDLAVST